MWQIAWLKAGLHIYNQNHLLLMLLFPLNMFTLIDFSIHVDRIIMELSAVYFKGSRVEISRVENYDAFLYKILSLSLPDELSNLVLHCLPKYLMRGSRKFCQRGSTQV